MEITISDKGIQQSLNILADVRLHGYFEPGIGWAETGYGRLWVENHDAILLKVVTERLIETLGTVPVRIEDGVAFYRQTDFVDLIAYFSVPQFGFQMSAELALYVRILKLATVLVAKQDVLAYAAPVRETVQKTYEACLMLGQSEEDGMGYWGAKTGQYAAGWVPAWREEADRALRMAYISVADDLLGDGWEPTVPWDMKQHGLYMVELFMQACIDHFMRQVLSEDAWSSADAGKNTYRILYRGEEDVIAAWRRALLDWEQHIFDADGWLVWRVLRESFRDSGWHAAWLNDRTGQFFYHLEFELIPPDAQSMLPDWRLKYFIVHNLWEIRAPLDEWWATKGRIWKVGKDRLEGPEVWILPMLRSAGLIYEPILHSMQTINPTECLVSVDDVFELLSYKLAAIRDLGCTIRTPELNVTDNITDVRIRVQVKRSKTKQVFGKNLSQRPMNWLDSQQLIEFDWTVAIDDMELSRQEFERMVEQRTSLVQLDGSWRLIPMQEILEQLNELNGSMKDVSSIGNMLQVARTVLMSHSENADSAVQVDLSYGEEAGEVRQMMSTLLRAHEPTLVPTPAGFQGVLRSYQAFGFAWLLHLRQIGCGGCLADDMGLGKTIQVLSYFQYLKENALVDGTHLLICPTSLLQNWKAEIQQFTPTLKVHVHHGSNRNMAKDGEDSPLQAVLKRGYDLIMTTYATAVRDLDMLSQTKWDAVVVDEAQNVKNALTKQAHAVRQLQARHRIALTGTPVENRLEELWSIFQFTNPGYLGGMAWFRRKFADPISGNPESQAARQLHGLMRPVLLRRRKTDPAIQMELPEKWEVHEYAGLTSEQGAVYQSVVNQLFVKLGDGSTSMSRKGQILTALVRLKQVCDHPCLVAGGSASLGRSGKLKLLVDLLRDVIEEGESALIFTQFRDMGEIIAEALLEQFGWKPQFLHGGLKSVKRGEIVDDFQSGKDPSPVLILSLKAGGVGLNLTRANHVFHFDRWWNPAVEDQATDRAFRIGQTKDVQVHKLICTGTMEERIDALIRTKRQLSDAVVGESEGWITEMDNDALRTLFALDADLSVEDDD